MDLETMLDKDDTSVVYYDRFREGKGARSEIKLKASRAVKEMKINWKLTTIMLIGFVVISSMLVASFLLIGKINGTVQTSEKEIQNVVLELKNLHWNINHSIGNGMAEAGKTVAPPEYRKKIDLNSLFINETVEKLTRMFMSSFGWVKGPNDYYYKMVREKLSYRSARNRCNYIGARLASKGIRDNATRVFLFTNYVKPMNEDTWVGLDDLRREGTFVWSDGVVSNEENTAWVPGEPNDLHGEDCAHFRPKVHDGGLNDIACSSNMYFICEAMF